MVERERLSQASDGKLLDAADQLVDGQLGVIAQLTVEELADVFVLIFGWVADQKQAAGLPWQHWELSPKSALRLGKWLKRSIAMHGLAWLEKWLPDILLVAFVLYEVQSRRRLDAAYAAERTAATKKKDAPKAAAP